MCNIFSPQYFQALHSETSFFLRYFIHHFKQWQMLLCFRLDYCGIAILIMGSFVPWLYYGFYCHFYPKIIYMSMVMALGIMAMIVSLGDKFSSPSLRSVRAGMLSLSFPILLWTIQSEHCFYFRIKNREDAGFLVVLYQSKIDTTKFDSTDWFQHTDKKY